MKDDSWLPKLGQALRAPEQRKANEGVERRFQEVGFDLELTLKEQSPGRPGDKNYEGQKPQVFQGVKNMSETTAGASQIPQQMLEQMNDLRKAGATIGIPIVVQLDEKAIAALKGQPTFTQDLARFSAKAGVAAAFGLGSALIFWVVTKPADPIPMPG